jgi:serine/threonine-protein kinase
MGRSNIEVGDLINNRYQIIRPLGEGAMGQVFLASDMLLGNNQVALKVLNKSLSNADELLKRFFREVELMNKVNHSAIARTYDVGQDQNLVYFSMEYLEGPSLDVLINDSQSLAIERVCSLISQILEGLEAIHSQGIIHRDLKPSNIIVLPNDAVKITDFGIARNQNSQLTEVGAILGTLEYLAPELILGHNVTHHADLYSAGCILYKLLSGRLPFDAANPGKLLLAHVEQYVPPPINYRPDTPQWLSHLTMKLLAKTTRERVQSARQALDIIRSHQSRTSNGTTQNPIPIDTSAIFDRRESAKIAISRRMQQAEINALISQRKRTRALNLIVSCAGILLFVIAPLAIGLYHLSWVCQILMLR